MKKDKQQSPIKAARKAIQESLIKTLKSIADQFQKQGIHADIDLEKESKKLAKKITKGAKVDHPSAPKETTPAQEAQAPAKTAAPAKAKPIAKAAAPKAQKVAAPAALAKPAAPATEPKAQKVVAPAAPAKPVAPAATPKTARAAQKNAAEKK
jgi:hypothetical protein